MKKSIINSAQKEYNEVEFEKLELSEQIFEGYRFDGCKFVKCDFNKTSFLGCHFVDCEFSHCNLSLIKVNRSSFLSVEFSDSKIVGVNWGFAYWPQINLASPLHFQRCDLSLSSFFELTLAEMTIEECKAHGVDFRGADLSHANFAFSDFLDSQFVHTKMVSADFTEAINYSIDLQLNDIKKAKFSFPEAISLLEVFEIEIVGLSR